MLVNLVVTVLDVMDALEPAGIVRDVLETAAETVQPLVHLVVQVDVMDVQVVVADAHQTAQGTVQEDVLAAQEVVQALV